MIDETYINKIASYYETNHHLGDTARTFHISTTKCKKILITKGVYKSKGKKTEAILTLYKKGMSTEQIAKKLEVSERYVQAIAPYRKGIYNLLAKSKNAKRIEKCREKKIKGECL